MRSLVAIAALALAGCATSSTTTPVYDAHFGDAVRNAKQMMALNPAPAPIVQGGDGQAAHEAMKRYYDSFKEPPPVVNVINIGGEMGTGGAGR